VTYLIRDLHFYYYLFKMFFFNVFRFLIYEGKGSGVKIQINDFHFMRYDPHLIKLFIKI
jgi:hypothetical protein